MWIICWVLWIWLINHFDCGIQTSFCMLKRNPFWWELAMTLMSIFVLCLLRIWPWWVFCIFVYYASMNFWGKGVHVIVIPLHEFGWGSVESNLRWWRICISLITYIVPLISLSYKKKKYKKKICVWLWILNKLIRVGHVYPISISLSYICLKCS